MSRPRAKDIMTEGIVAIEADASVEDAARKMRDNDIRSLVIIEDDEAVGIVAGKDMLYKVVAENRSPSDLTVREVMTEDVITASEEEDVYDIADVMIRNNISRVPVFRGEQVVGMISQSNMLRAWPGYTDLLEEKASSGRMEL